MMEGGVGRIPLTPDIIRPQMLQLRDLRPFKTSDEYLWAMKEDLSDWLLTLYPELSITPTTFMESLETGVTICKHANNVRVACLEWLEQGKKLPKCWGKEWKLPSGDVSFNPNAKPETFFARDNVHNFITWCRKLGIFECLLFESDDLIMRKNERSVILCLLEVARRGSHFGMAAPMLVQFEKEIDRDIAKDIGVDLSSSGEEEESLLEYGPVAQIVTNDLRSLDERVRELVERCSCPTQFPMIRVAEGKYRIGNTKVMIYVRILRNHVMVRVGGGWDTLGHYLDKHDPCRCSSSHRAAISSRLTVKNDGASPRMKVEYERRDLSLDGHLAQPALNGNKKADLSDSGSEISDEGYKTSDNSKISLLEKQVSVGGSSKDSRLNGSYRNSMTRARSMSTDEDRPDSRSTDEDSMLAVTPQKPVERVLRSQSTSRVPNVYSRTSSTDRSGHSPRKRFDNPEPSGRKPFSHPPPVLHNRTPTHVRSLSASGSSEFYGRNPVASNGPRSNKGQSGYPSQQVQSSRPTPAQNTTPQRSGKNTWNGYGTGPRVRARPTVQNLFGQSKRQNSDLGVGQGRRPSLAGDSNLDSPLPDLASCIKQALELNSDAEKISHIEMMIKQYESQRPDIVPNETISLPFINSGSLSAPPKPVGVNKRKELGFSKIPKPKFF